MEFHQKHPLNVETKLSSLTSHFITPTNLLFHRNHDEVPFDSTLRRQDYQDYQLQLSLPSDLKHKLGCIWNWKQESELESKGEQMPQSSSSNNSSSTCDTLNLPLSQLKDSYPQQRLAATLECAGNRRAEFNQNEGTEEDDDLKAEGIEWGPGVLGCCVWQGISLRSLLLDLGLPDPYSASPPTSADLSTTRTCSSWASKLHVHFFSSQESSEGKELLGREGESPEASQCNDQISIENFELSHFGASLPLSVVLHPLCNITLAFGMNGQSITKEHGYPLRVVAPGFVGARWVKWLNRIEIREDESESFGMALDYKVLEPPQGEEEKRETWIERVMGKGKSGGKDKAFREKLMKRHGPIMRMGVGSYVVSPQENEKIEKGSLIRGYATGTDGHPISTVSYLLISTSSFKGETPTETEIRSFARNQPLTSWRSANVLPPERNAASKACGITKDDAEDESSGYRWAWRLWDRRILGEAGSGSFHLVVKAETESGIEQECETPFNVRGFHQRSWPVVKNLRYQ